MHGNVNSNGYNLSRLFEEENYTGILRFLKYGRSNSGAYQGRPYIMPGDPEQSAFYLQVRDGVMQGRFSEKQMNVIKNWILQVT